MKFSKLTCIAASAVMCTSMLSTFPASGNTEYSLVDSGIDYTESTETINNPGAGYTSTLWCYCAPGETPVYNPTGNIMLILVDIGGFSSGANGTYNEDGSYNPGTDYDLDETFFTNLRKTLENCRRNGCTIALRFRYDSSGLLNPEPETYDKMIEHIEQIRSDGLLEDYKDIIAFVETGFVGSWGEHWGGKFCSFEDKARLVDILLDVVPEEIPITVRTPKTFATWAGIDETELGDYVLDPESEAARIGLYNDGYMGSDSDLGTYHDRERDIKWLNTQTLYSYFGGEFSGNLEFTMQYDTYLPENAVPEMYQTHLSYINSNIYQLYKNYTFGEKYDVDNVDNSAYYGETVFKFIRDHIGYRFVLRNCMLSESVSQGETLLVCPDIENTGFANPLMEQKAEIILEKDGNYIKTEVDADTKKWYSCSTVSPEFELKIPGALEPGDWNVYFKLSTGNNTMEQMHMRSVKFANNDTWNSALGANYLGTVEVVPSNGSSLKTDGSFYQVNAENPVSRSDGEMLTINGIAAADGYAGSLSERSDENKYASDETSGNSLYITNDDKYLYVMAEINQNASAPVYNLAIDNKSNGKNYWLYYQGNGFVYFNTGTPYGCVQRNYGNTVEFAIPLGELMELGQGTVLSNVRVFIQDESDSWKNVGELNSGEYTVSGNFNIYSAKRTVCLSSGSSITLNALASAADLKYQWLFNGTPIEGAADSSFTVHASSEEAVGLYSVEITSPDGTVKTADICEVAQVLPEALMGDVNLNGAVNVADLVMLQKYLVKAERLTAQQALPADVNCDGLVDSFDNVLLRKLIVENSVGGLNP